VMPADPTETSALFRYAVIAEALNPRLGAKERGRLAREIAARVHTMPGSSGRTPICAWPGTGLQTSCGLWHGRTASAERRSGTVSAYLGWRLCIPTAEVSRDRHLSGKGIEEISLDEAECSGDDLNQVSGDLGEVILSTATEGLDDGHSTGSDGSATP